MVFDYYLAVVALTIFASAAMIVIIVGNSRLTKTQKSLFIVTLALLIPAAAAEYFGVALNGAPEWTRGIHTAIKVFELSVSPIMVFCLVAVFNGFKSAYKMIPIAAANAVLQVVSGFTGLLYYMDADNVYRHNTFYFLYTIVYIICGLIFFWECLKFSRHYQNRNYMSMLAILLFLAAGLCIHAVVSEIRTDWITILISLILFCNYYNSTSEQIDSLTQLLDRKSFDTNITAINRKAIILLFDVDHFKEINDTYGHDAGDVCLHTVAAAILSAYAHMGYCYRIGGDEFCVVTRKMQDMSAANDNFAKTLDGMRKNTNTFIPNVSVGCAAFDPQSMTITDAIKKADEQMYIIKSKAQTKKEVKHMDDKKNISVPQLHTIPYPEKYRDHLKENGATAFDGKTNHLNSRYYVFNDYYNMQSDDTLHILTHFETYQQTTEYTCGAACALMVLNWFGAKKYHEIAVGNLIESKPGVGSSVANIADFFDVIGWNVEHHADSNLCFDSVESLEKSLIETIDRGIPVMVDWVDWAGHWQVIIGIDTCGSDTAYDDVLIFADPYDVTDHFQDGYYIFPLSRFFGMWQEGPCAKKETPYKQPFVIAYPNDYKNAPKP